MQIDKNNDIKALHRLDKQGLIKEDIFVNKNLKSTYLSMVL